MNHINCGLPLIFHRKSGKIRIICLSILLALFSCKSQKDTLLPEPEFNPLISAFTSGLISAESSVRVRLSADLENIPEGKTELKDKIFEFNPAIKGTTHIVDKRTLEFRPEKRMPAGTQYKARFLISKLFKDVSDIKDFAFSFKTIPLNIDVIFDGLRAYSKTDLKYTKIQAKLLSSDQLSPDEIETFISASQGNNNLPVEWLQQEDGKIHYFIIDSVSRSEKKELARISWKGKGDGFSFEGSREFEIPSLDEFILLDQKVIQYPEQYIELTFSDPLKTNQNLDGLIYLENFTDLRFNIEDNIIKVYPVIRQKGSLKIIISPGIQNIIGKKIVDEKTAILNFEAFKPAIRLLGKGVILPHSDGLFFPFETVNLKGIDLRIIKIFEHNVGQFLQMNNLDGDYELKRAGRLIAKKSIDLISERPVNLNEWNSFSLDLSELIDSEPGAIYRVELSFRRKHSLFECPEMNTISESDDFDDLRITEKEMAMNDLPSYYAWEDYDYFNYDWHHRDDPCNDAYYAFDNKVGRNVLASNFGIIAKYGNDKSILFAVTDLLTTDPLQNVKLDIYNFQQQLITSLITDKNGIAGTILESQPFFLIASKDRQRGYLRLDQGSSLSLSRFDITGTSVNRGIKGFIYGERGVWRPGDTLFITFILEDKDGHLPENHPVTLEWFDPRGKRVSKYTSINGLNGFYNFKIVTKPEDPTGNWNAKVSVGNLMFSKNFRIETIKPNRLKINLNFDADELRSDRASVLATLSSNWLHGAPASNLKAAVSVNFKNINTSFPGYSDYIFTDPSRSFKPAEQEVFRGTLDQNGFTTFSTVFDLKEQSPGKVNALFTSRIFEKGGDYSTDLYSIPYSPYSFYTGLKIPAAVHNDMLLTDTLYNFEIVTLNEDASPVDRKNLQVLIYKLDWKWWWHAGDENLASYIGSSYYKPVFEKKLNTVKGKALFSFGVESPDWGRFFIRVYDPEGKHSTGKIVYFDYPGWAGRSDREDTSAASMLSFSASKTKYAPGETAQITVPSGEKGRIFLSIENGTRVLQHHWIKTSGAETTFSFKVTKEMSPNIFVNISLIQPHNQSVNDLPVRMYGVIPIMVEDSDTRLNPVLKLPEVLKPLSEAEITVSERSGKEMTYTLAIVDEGLLDLTRYKTPDPWNTFYAREALGVNSFDLYDHVLGVFGGRIDGIFSIGGDGEATVQQQEGRAKRFPPVVRYLGPFHLPAGKIQKHKINIPNYAGSLKTMIVAGNKGAYGSDEKSTPVRNPLMILSTLPSVLRPSETIALPVSVFAMEDRINEVDLLLEHSNNFTSAKAKQKVKFSETGEKTVDFILNTTELNGRGNIKITAVSGSERAISETEIEIQSANPKISNFIYGVVEPGKTWMGNYDLPGMKGTNTGILEVSALQPVDFGRRLAFLNTYTYDGAEQIISGAFPQLYLADVMEMNEKKIALIKNNIEMAIQKLVSMQLSGGGIGNRPDTGHENEWVTSYAGHFLLEARKKGYVISPNFLNNWLRFQKQAAKSWTGSVNMNQYEKSSSELSQAYRLFTLALAGEPETGAMNRLREKPNINSIAGWRLAAAYALSGQTESARKIAEKIGTDLITYPDPGITYGSVLRDMAIILESMILIGEREKSVPLLQEISEMLSSDSWYSTQSLANALIAVSAFAGGIKTTDELKYDYVIDNEQLKYAASNASFSTVEHFFKHDGSGSVRVSNKGKALLYVRFTVSGTPVHGKEKTYSSNLSLSVKYLDMSGNNLDISKLEQGTDFIALVTVYNPGNLGNYRDMALTQVFPSGWEIQNIRLFESDPGKYSIPEYQDIRDDRVITYFNIDRGKREQFAVKLNAAYKGKFYLPATYCEAMYRPDINALEEGREVEVVEAGQADSILSD